MARRSNAGLALLTVAAVAVAIYLAQTHRPITEVERLPLHPGLAARANDIARIEVRDARTHTELARAGDGWVVANRGNHSALSEPVKALVVAASALRVLEGKTNDPALYPRLGVEPLEAADSRARRVRMTAADGEVLADFLVGKVREAREGGLTTLRGLYVRREGEAQALLVEGELNAPTAPADWMQRMLMDIPGEQVQRMHLGDTLTARRERPGDADFDLAPIPEGRRLRSQAMVNSLATALTELRFDDVHTAEARPLEGPSLHTTRLVTFDGLSVAVHSAILEDGVWTRFEFTHEPPAATPGGGEGAAEAAPDSDTAGTSAAAQAAALSTRTAGWVYRLPAFKTDMLRRALEELTADATPTSSGAPAGSVPPKAPDAAAGGTGLPTPAP